MSPRDDNRKTQNKLFLPPVPGSNMIGHTRSFSVSPPTTFGIAVV